MNATRGSGRHRTTTRPSRPRPPSLWQRVRRTVTAGVFLAATVAGVGVGLQGAQVSPVAPTTPAVVADVAAPAPTVTDGDPALRPAGPRERGHHR